MTSIKSDFLLFFFYYKITFPIVYKIFFLMRSMWLRNHPFPPNLLTYCFFLSVLLGSCRKCPWMDQNFLVWFLTFAKTIVSGLGDHSGVIECYLYKQYLFIMLKPVIRRNLLLYCVHSSRRDWKNMCWHSLYILMAYITSAFSEL